MWSKIDYIRQNLALSLMSSSSSCLEHRRSVQKLSHFFDTSSNHPKKMSVSKNRSTYGSTKKTTLIPFYISFFHYFCFIMISCDVILNVFCTASPLAIVWFTRCWLIAAPLLMMIIRCEKYLTSVVSALVWKKI